MRVRFENRYSGTKAQAHQMTVHIDRDQPAAITHESAKPLYTIEELLAASDYSCAQSVREREWIDAPRAAKELL